MDAGVTQFGCYSFKLLFLVAVPLGVMMAAVKFSILARKIFMVEVKPVVFLQLSQMDFFIPECFIVNFCIGKSQGHGIIPGLFIGRRVNGDLWFLFQQNNVHVALFNCRININKTGSIYLFKGNAADSAFGLYKLVCIQ